MCPPPGSRPGRPGPYLPQPWLAYTEAWVQALSLSLRTWAQPDGKGWVGKGGICHAFLFTRQVGQEKKGWERSLTGSLVPGPRLWDARGGNRKVGPIF